MKNNNSVMAVHPYLDQGAWVFDDSSKGLVKEPFIAGIDKMISKIVNHLHLDKKGFSIYFSSSYLPNSTFSLDWLRSDGGGNWYKCDQLNMEGWLCPALYKYFSEAPKKIYVLFSNKNG